jgi:hypothetical protein
MRLKYDIGFVKRRPNTRDEYIASCGCGTITLLGSLGWRELERMDVACRNKECRNKNFINLTNKNRDIFPYIKVLHKDRKGFKIMRTNLSVFHDDDFNVLIKPNMVQVFKYSLLDGTMKLYKNGEDIKLSHWNKEDVVGRFFRGVDDSKAVKMVSTIETEALYDFIYSKLSYKTNRTWGDRKFWKGLIEFATGKYTYMQILSNAGFPNIERFYEKKTYYSTPTINQDGTSPKDILGVPKFVLKYIRENQNVGTYEIKQIKSALKKVDGNRFRELMSIVKDESTIRELCNTLDNLIEIHDTYGYNNLKKLTLYIFREIRMTQGIDSPSNGAGLLRDYIRMATKLGQEYEKYPKSLKKEHDITMMNYKVQQDAMKKQEFADMVVSEPYKRLEYKKKDFSIITPKEMQDLINEGNELSHCVASYVESIVSGRCQILFLRDTKRLEEPLATIEVRGENVRQARGFANRALRVAERDFVAEWAKKKELQLNYYY